jgi:hypothetical protein
MVNCIKRGTKSVIPEILCITAWSIDVEPGDGVHGETRGCSNICCSSACDLDRLVACYFNVAGKAWSPDCRNSTWCVGEVGAFEITFEEENSSCSL